MSTSDLVRPSRDGDQFHYTWAARRCLQLLPPNSALVAVAIEGSSESETEEPIGAGEELIDIAEYYGSEFLSDAQKIRYLQLKHSTRNPSDIWQLSGLEHTISGFAKRYKIVREHSAKLELVFVSNRPINSKILEALEDAANRRTPRYSTEHRKLIGFTGLDAEQFQDFCSVLTLSGDQPNLWEQRDLLFDELCQFLPGVDASAGLELKDLITKKAGTDGEKDNCIRRADVLRSLKTAPEELYPADCQIERRDGLIPREGISDMLAQINNAGNKPVVIHAAGGVGKSVAILQLASGIPDGSVAIIYDCFGNGDYMNRVKTRHRAREGLVQIANDLAGYALCYPLIPAPYNDSKDFLRTCLSRLEQAVQELRKKTSDALLYLFVDAADNAEMAAKDFDETPSFIRELLRASIPEGVRLVASCRTHRRSFLTLPPDVVEIKLESFSFEESATHLRRFFPNASEQDSQEFHRLTSHNPRVQAIALSQKIKLGEVLRSLGTTPRNAEDTIRSLLELALARLKDSSGQTETDQIEVICAGLAILRPLIPVRILAQISGVEESAVESFATDLGHPLRLIGGHLQFTDEPTESWFREEYRPSGLRLMEFIKNIQPLAATSVYVSSMLPQLMLEADMLDELVELSLSEQALPSDNPIARREIELNRLQYALKACLRNGKLGAAAKLALKAGVETAGHSRQEGLVRNHPDLASRYLDVEILEDYANRGFSGAGWRDAHYAYEACLLSNQEELLSDARSKLRIAHDGLRSWSGLNKEQREREQITTGDIFMLAQAAYNLSGADACAYEVRRWTPKSLAYSIGKRLSRWLIDNGRYAEVDDLAQAAGNDIFFVLGLNLELRSVHRNLPVGILLRSLKLLESPLVKLVSQNTYADHDELKRATRVITAFIESLIVCKVGDADRWLSLLNRYLPEQRPLGLVYRYQRHLSPYLKAYALQAELMGVSLDEKYLAHPELLRAIEEDKHRNSRDIIEYRHQVRVLLPLLRAWGRAILRGESTLDSVPPIPTDSDGGSNDLDLRNNGVLLWLDVILILPKSAVEARRIFFQWMEASESSFYTGTFISICRTSARIPEMNEYAYVYAERARERIDQTREDADTRTTHMIALARAVLALDSIEAKALFESAVEHAGKFGDETRDRWIALLDLADRANFAADDAPEVAYRLARASELILDYYELSSADWKGLIHSISRICPRSTFAIISRWRDRNIGDPLEQLRFASDVLIEFGKIEAADALPLTCIQADWDICAMTERALAGSSNTAEASEFIRFVYKYLRLNDQHAEVWNKFSELIKKYGISVSDIEMELEAFKAVPEPKVSSYSGSGQLNTRAKVEAEPDPLEAITWDVLDLYAQEGLQAAYQQFQIIRREHHLSEWQFYEAVYSRIERGKEAVFLGAFSQTACVSYYDLKSFFDSIPDAWLRRQSIKQELNRLLKVIVRRHCFSISRNRTYDHFPLSAICNRIGLDIEPLINEVLLSIGRSPEMASPARLFSLMALITPKLIESQANEALCFGLSAIEEVEDTAEADGPWRQELSPPLAVKACYAGYIWACLSAPKSSLRWQAAHVVRGLCKLGRREILAELLDYARENQSASAFGDARFHFYKFHALQWFLLALSRSAKESPRVVTDFSDFLLEQALEGSPHIMIRRYAKQALQPLIDLGFVDELHRENIQAVNEPTLHPEQIPENARSELIGSGFDESPEAGDLYFGIDFEPYWFSPLGRCFALSPKVVAAKASSVIRDDWQTPEGLKYAEDQRSVVKIYQYPENNHSHGTYPKVDDLSFYLSYHAMMIVAGQLLSSEPLRPEADDELYEFSKWIRRHDVTRRDGDWLFDRRDPFPLKRPDWMQSTESDTDWRWLVTRDDFAKVLFEDDERLNLWGHWNWTHRGLDETFSVTSGIVPQDRSEALLRALQTTDDPMDFYVPDADDHREVLSGEYELRGWVDEFYKDGGIDTFDPWGAQIRWPVPAPAGYVRECLVLKSYDDARVWKLQQDGEAVDSLWSQTWKREPSDTRDAIEEGGSRLQANLPFVLALLRKLKKDMIIEVQISRNKRGLSYRDEPDEYKYVPANSKLFLIKESGEIITF